MPLYVHFTTGSANLTNFLPNNMRKCHYIHEAVAGPRYKQSHMWLLNYAHNQIRTGVRIGAVGK